MERSQRIKLKCLITVVSVSLGQALDENDPSKSLVDVLFKVLYGDMQSCDLDCAYICGHLLEWS
jgi:hypothetical protein